MSKVCKIYIKANNIVKVVMSCLLSMMWQINIGKTHKVSIGSLSTTLGLASMMSMSVSMAFLGL